MRVRVGDADEFVVFRDAFGAGEGTGLDLAGAEADGEMGNRDIFGFARTMRHDGIKAGAFSEHDGVDSLGESADLIGLH